MYCRFQKVRPAIGFRFRVERPSSLIPTLLNMDHVHLSMRNRSFVSIHCHTSVQASFGIDAGDRFGGL